MYRRLLAPLRALSLLIICSLMPACDRVELAYRNLDVIIPWTLSDYLDMNARQKTWFKERLGAHLRWHCSTQLPGYLAWLDRVQQMVASNQVNDQQLQARAQEAQKAMNDIAAAITPSAVELLRGLDDEQVGEMRQAFARDVRQREERYVRTPMDEQIGNRAERMEKRLTPWLGELTPEQSRLVEAWSQSLIEQNRLSLDNRARWQAQMSAALAQRQSPEFGQQIQRLLTNRQSVWTPQYRQFNARAEQAGRSLLVDLMQASTPAQRQHLQERLADVRKDFSELKCLKVAKS
ncbi:DUF6279 family lipoprotein [Pseudomonas akapageensis]|uniref:DUF6279 family lipoprotein n=1 Tax=Pseudomonas akapageensis TaxID=2609961 RepID=UPI00140CFDD2|nr:DUF6279 family lipoprotein [Pseudomonas akapageensis]